MTGPKWRLKPLYLRPISSVAAPALVILLACGLASPRVRAANRAPNWLRAAAQEKLPSYPSSTKAVILLDETQVTVRDNGEIDTRHRLAIRLLRPEASTDYGEVDVDFDKNTKILSLNAWTIEPNGHEIDESEKDAVERGYLSDLEYADVRVKTLQYADANPGSVVGCEYVQRDRPYVFEDDWWFQHRVPVRTARFVLEVPDGWKYTTHWFNHAAVQSQQPAPNQHVWTLKDLPGIQTEPEMPVWRSVAGWMGIKYFPNNPALRAKSSGSWKEIGLWYDALTQSSRTDSPQIRQKVAGLTQGVSDPVQKIRALAGFVQRDVRYFAVEIGIGGYRPHPAPQVFAHLYGDCKDKATLLSSMLHDVGIQSYYVLIDTNRGFVKPAYPSIAFNHMILAIRLPDNVSDPTLYAVVNDPKLGRLLFFDPTNEYVPLGYLPSYLQSSYGLVVGPDGGQLVSLPLLPPSTNRLLRVAHLTLSPSGKLSGNIQELRWGGPAAQEREEFLDMQPSQRAQVFESFLGRFLENFVLTAASIGNLNRYSQTLTLDYKFFAPGYATTDGNSIILSPSVVGDKTSATLDLLTAHGKPRRYPVEFDEATRRDDLFDIKLPVGYAVEKLPSPVQANCDYATYHSDVSVANGVLHYKRTLKINAVLVPTARLPQLRGFLQQIAADQSSVVVLQRTSP